MKDDNGRRGWWTEGKATEQLLAGLRSGVEGRKE